MILVTAVVVTEKSYRTAQIYGGNHFQSAVITLFFTVLYFATNSLDFPSFCFESCVSQSGQQQADGECKSILVKRDNEILV